MMALACALSSVVACFAMPIAHAADRDLAKQQTIERQKIAEYAQARAAYESLADPYWKLIAKKRTKRRARRSFENLTASDYVLQQPPIYSGPPKPATSEGATSPAKPIPVVADFLREAKAQFGFVPEAATTENDYKRAYVVAARTAGLTTEQCVRIYAFKDPAATANMMCRPDLNMMCPPHAPSRRLSDTINC